MQTDTESTPITALSSLPPPALLPTPPSASPPAPASSPPTYKPITDDASIERLVGLAKDSLPDSALGIVWRHAFEEGRKNGYSEGAKLFEGADVNEISKVAAEKGIEIGRDREKRAWGAAGHSDKCITVARPPRGVAVQTENPPPRSTATSKVDLFQAGYDEGRREEQGDWLIEGHGHHCFPPTTVRSTQTDPEPPALLPTPS